jgi:hypothetical protein
MLSLPTNLIVRILGFRWKDMRGFSSLSWRLIENKKSEQTFKQQLERYSNVIGISPPQGEHKGSPLLWYGLASWCVRGGKGTFLSLYTAISRSVSFASKV